jgi:hypothetical protein
MPNTSLKPRFTPLWWIEADTRMIEAFSALASLVFSASLFSMWWFDQQLGAYRIMRELLPLWGWGIVFASVWLVQSYAMCGNVYVARLPASWLAFLSWGVVAFFFLWANPLSLAPYLIGLLASFMLWIIVKGPTDGKS